MLLKRDKLFLNLLSAAISIILKESNFMEKMLVSVIIPAYNCVTYLEQAVNSALTQTYSQLEILIIDDCSQDNTLKIVKSLAQKDNRIRVLKNEMNQGTAATRNRGLRESKGDFIAFLDGDDVWHPDKLERQLDLLKQTDAALCYTAYDFINAEGGSLPGQIYHVPEQCSLSRLLRENVIGCSTAIFRFKYGKEFFMRKDEPYC